MPPDFNASMFHSSSEDVSLQTRKREMESLIYYEMEICSSLQVEDALLQVRFGGTDGCRYASRSRCSRSSFSVFLFVYVGVVDSAVGVGLCIWTISE